MKPVMVEKSSKVARSPLAGRRGERLFYTGMTVAMVLTAFAGFAPTYYLRPYFNTSPLPPLLHLHGIVFTSWLALLFTQTTLVAANRTGVHRRLGIVGGALAVLMIVVGVMTAIIRTKQGMNLGDGSSPLAFLVIPLGDMAVFSSLVGAGFYFRRRADVHKRLMLLATISILTAAIARLPFEFMKAGPVAFFTLTDLFIVACVLYDLISRGRVHRATVWGGLLIIVSQPLRLLIASTDAWLAIATWLTGWAA